MKKFNKFPEFTAPEIIGSGIVKASRETLAEVKGTRIIRAGRAILTAIALTLLLSGCNNNNAEQPEPTPPAVVEVDNNDSQIELPQMIESAQGYAIAPELAGLGGMSQLPLDAWLYANQNERANGEVMTDGSRIFDLGWVALDPNETELADFNGATAVDTFLNASEDEYIHEARLPEEVSVYSFDDDGQLATVDRLAMSMDVDPSLQEQVNEQLAQPITPNNTEGHTIVSMTGVDVSGDGTIDFVVPKPITDFTIDFDSPNRTVYTHLEPGSTLHEKLGMHNMDRLDGTSYRNDYIEQLLQINPEIESVENIRPDQVFEVPFFLGTHNGG